MGAAEGQLWREENSPQGLTSVLREGVGEGAHTATGSLPVATTKLPPKGLSCPRMGWLVLPSA